MNETKTGMANLDHIHVFKTDIISEAELRSIRSIMDTHPGIESWSVDLTDDDKVLRVVARQLCPQDIIELIRQHGFDCADLS